MEIGRSCSLMCPRALEVQASPSRSEKMEGAGTRAGPCREVLMSSIPAAGNSLPSVDDSPKLVLRSEKWVQETDEALPVLEIFSNHWQLTWNRSKEEPSQCRSNSPQFGLRRNTIMEANLAKQNLQYPLLLISSARVPAPQIIGVDARGCQSTGTFLNGLKPVPFDPILDVRPFSCFNCRTGVHHRSRCPEPANQRKFCRNCGRYDVTVSRCVRCAEAYARYLNARVKTVRATREPLVMHMDALAEPRLRIIAAEAHGQAMAKDERTIEPRKKKQRRGGRLRRERIEAKKALEALKTGQDVVGLAAAKRGKAGAPGLHPGESGDN
ncbi:uncharacterized protein LOC131672435 [Phymastichus coffea]|uniref:uncharacterized protein LOC131672435 n=1 Tax=Phymastichus coffea TaxID=108790 RepID=UPI00273B3EA0|nr:uncharacterized protein LOC131672435 [Phymastichus coffea]XP_058805629.1 uncharacterized protein LOC131672435 [Phymastichus coffea]